MIGNLLNQYRLDEVVGQGGMGVVYRALDLNLGRTVAVKVLSASFRDDPEFVARFHQEARIQAGLNHPNIATLFDFFVWNDMPVAVMEFIKGESLRSLVDRSGPMAAHIALPIIVQALRGVAAGHKRGIIHRDLKPSNLMMTDEGVVKITDFGIAKVRSDTGLTRVSTRVGSTSYMAPEQILGRPVDEKTDIYIIGGTLYELLTGRPPFQGLSQFEIDSAHVRDPPTIPTEFRASLPPKAVEAVMRALAKEPAERFASADEFIEALQPPQTNTPKAVHARRAVTTFVASGLLALLVTGIVLFFVRQARVGTDHPAAPSQLAHTQLSRPATPSPATEGSHDLTGMWTGTYADRSGKALLHLLNLQLQQLGNGDVTGRFVYETGSSPGDECTLDKSSYSTQSKRLRLITHCRNPDHPKYLNVPLEFNGVDPGAATVGGGRLAFHLADDIVATLERISVRGAPLSAAEGLPAVATRPISDLKPTATIHVGKTADWVAITSGAVWVGSTGPDAVHRIDPRTNKQVATVMLPGAPCAGLATGFGSLWVPLCSHPATLAKVDLNRNALSAVLGIGPAGPEGGITTSPDSIWLVLDKNGSLARIDPDKGTVRQTIQIPPGSYNPFYMDGQVWVTRVAGAEVTAVDADNGVVLGTVKTGPNPRFLTAGAGAVWTLNQGDGSLTCIDARARRVTRTIALGTPGHGGDISIGAGMVWTTVAKVPLSAVDSSASVLRCQWVGSGGDSLGIGHGAIWLTDYHGGTLSRLELENALRHCP